MNRLQPSVNCNNCLTLWCLAVVNKAPNLAVSLSIFQEEKKALVERKIEEQARLEKEREQKERKTLFAEREHKKATIKALEAKMARVQEFERWEASQKHLGNFILTKAKPHVYWLPKKMEDKANEKLNTSREFHESKHCILVCLLILFYTEYKKIIILSKKIMSIYVNTHD